MTIRIAINAPNARRADIDTDARYDAMIAAFTKMGITSEPEVTIDTRRYVVAGITVTCNSQRGHRIDVPKGVEAVVRSIYGSSLTAAPGKHGRPRRSR